MVFQSKQTKTTGDKDFVLIAIPAGSVACELTFMTSSAFYSQTKLPSKARY